MILDYVLAIVVTTKALESLAIMISAYSDTVVELEGVQGVR